MNRETEILVGNGDVFDIGQTINGISKFIMIGGEWHYFDKTMSKRYEYDQDDLTSLVNNESGLEEVKYLGNIFDHGK